MKYNILTSMIALGLLASTSAMAADMPETTQTLSILNNSTAVALSDKEMSAIKGKDITIVSSYTGESYTHPAAVNGTITVGTANGSRNSRPVTR